MSAEHAGLSGVDMSRRALLGAAIAFGALEGAKFLSSHMFDGHNESTDPQQSEGSSHTNSESHETDHGRSAPHMHFIGMPESPEKARDDAVAMAEQLRAWNQSGMRPLVIMEPTARGGSITIDMNLTAKPAYRPTLEAYFSTLADQGITKSEMGIWVPFPEANTPVWHNGVTSSTLFMKNVSQVSASAKRAIPGTHISVMLDSQTFPISPDLEWESGTFDPTALAPYLKFKRGIVDSFGLQGFSWNADDTAKDYLSSRAMRFGASTLGTSHIWLNTGSYSTVNNPDNGHILHASTERRAEVLAQVLKQVRNAQSAGLSIDFINIFGEDKLDRYNPGTADYNYHGPDEAVLEKFTAQAEDAGIPVAVFTGR